MGVCNDVEEIVKRRVGRVLMCSVATASYFGFVNGAAQATVLSLTPEGAYAVEAPLADKDSGEADAATSGREAISAPTHGLNSKDAVPRTPAFNGSDFNSPFADGQVSRSVSSSEIANSMDAAGGGQVQRPLVATINLSASAVLDPSTLDMLITPNLREYPKLDRHIVQAVVAIESGGRVDAVSLKGAQGLMQLMPDTARRLGVQNAFDPAENIRGGMSELARLIDIYDDLSLALAAYNAGEGAVDEHKGIPPYAETQAYVVRILQHMNRSRSAEVKALRSGDFANLEMLGLARKYLAQGAAEGELGRKDPIHVEGIGPSGPIMVDISVISP